MNKREVNFAYFLFGAYAIDRGRGLFFGLSDLRCSDVTSSFTKMLYCEDQFLLDNRKRVRVGMKRVVLVSAKAPTIADMMSQGGRPTSN
jgi:hypothetical protein